MSMILTILEMDKNGQKACMGYIEQATRKESNPDTRKGNQLRERNNQATTKE